MSITLKLFQVDAFTDKLFKGNPAGVCILNASDSLNEEQMLNIASEMNLSETAFVTPLDSCMIDQSSAYKIRWFTPETEVDLCGHATLSSAKVLFDVLGVESDRISFESKSGKLTAERSPKGIKIGLPKGKPQKIHIPFSVVECLNIKKEDCNDAAYCKDSKNLILRMKNEETLRNLKPNFYKLRNYQPEEGIETLIITSLSISDYDFVSRCFAPWQGINEDPVTGSAHAVLAPYWSNIHNKISFKAYQASKRGGEMLVDIDDNIVSIIGNAVMVFQSELNID